MAGWTIPQKFHAAKYRRFTVFHSEEQKMHLNSKMHIVLTYEEVFGHGHIMERLYCICCYRKWVLRHLMEHYLDTNSSISELPPLIQEELCVCTAAAEGYANNYNAWSHRLWAMEHVAAWDTEVSRRYGMKRLEH